MTDIGRLSDVLLDENATCVFDLNHFGYGDASAGGARLAPAVYGAGNMYPAPGIGRAGILVSNSDVTAWRWICIVPAGEPFVNCENSDPLRIIRSTFDDPTILPPSGPGMATEHRSDDPPQSGAGAIGVLSATYGSNCRAPAGNVTEHLAQECGDAQTCTCTIGYTVIGDPVHGCATTYFAEYACDDGRIRRVTAEPEAGYQRQVTLDCAGG